MRPVGIRFSCRPSSTGTSSTCSSSHCADVGRDPGEIRKQLVVRAALGDTEREAEECLRERAAVLGGDLDAMRREWIVGTPEQCVERLGPYVAELGVVDLILFARPPADLQTLGLLAREVAPALRGL